MSDGSGSNASSRTLAGKLVMLLEAVASSENGVGVRELARRTGIDKSAVSRLFNQLLELGVVSQSESSGRYMVGPRLSALVARLHAKDTLWQAAAPIMRRLARQYNETCYLATREDDQVMFREKIDSDRTIRYVIELGQTSPLHAGAGGRAILAGMPRDEVEALIDQGPLERLTPNTITDPDELLRQVDEDRKRGYSVSMGERVAEGSAVAAPYYDGTGQCRGSVVFTCPAERFDVRRVAEIADDVVAASRELSIRLGHVPEDDGDPG